MSTNKKTYRSINDLYQRCTAGSFCLESAIKLKGDVLVEMVRAILRSNECSPLVPDDGYTLFVADATANLPQRTLLVLPEGGDGNTQTLTPLFVDEGEFRVLLLPGARWQAFASSTIEFVNQQCDRHHFARPNWTAESMTALFSMDLFGDNPDMIHSSLPTKQRPADARRCVFTGVSAQQLEVLCPRESSK